MKEEEISSRVALTVFSTAGEEVRVEMRKKRILISQLSKLNRILLKFIYYVRKDQGRENPATLRACTDFLAAVGAHHPAKDGKKTFM